MTKMSNQDGRDNHQDDSKVLKWTIILSSVVIGLTVDYFVPGWGRLVLLTLLIFGSLVGFCRAYWGTAFWMTFAGTLALHSALMFEFRNGINQLPLPGLFLCAVAEVIVLAVILGLVFPDSKHSSCDTGNRG